MQQNQLQDLLFSILFLSNYVSKTLVLLKRIKLNLCTCNDNKPMAIFSGMTQNKEFQTNTPIR